MKCNVYLKYTYDLPLRDLLTVQCPLSIRFFSSTIMASKFLDAALRVFLTEFPVTLIPSFAKHSKPWSVTPRIGQCWLGF